MTKEEGQPRLPQELIWKLINSFPFPIILFDRKSNSFQTNPAAENIFSNIELNELENLTDGNKESIQTRTGIYKIISIIEDDENYSAILLLKDESDRERELKSTAHDLNNIFTSINNTIELIRHKNQLNKENKQLFNTLETNIIRASELIEMMLSKDTATSVKFNKLKIEDLFSAVSETVKQILPEGINYNCTIESGIKDISGNFTLLYRALLNLIVNAKESIIDKGFINVRAKNILDKEQKIIVTVTDSGIGIKEEDLKHIFDSGFSTKNKTTESGIGLNSVKEIIEMHGGSISVTSKINDGASFSFSLPALVESDNKVDKIKCKILIAEDDNVILEELCELLRYENFDPLKASNGKEVIEILEKNNSIDLLIIDKKMPVMDGIECITKIREKNVDIRIILASGSTSQNYENDYMHLKIDKFVLKPYKIEELLKNVAELF